VSEGRIPLDTPTYERKVNMMAGILTFEEFKNKVAEGVEGRANGRLHIRVAENLKNNGLKLTGISAVRDGINISPTVYLESHYLDYIRNVNNVDEIVDMVYGRFALEDNTPSFSFDVQDFIKWEKVKPNVYSKLINADKNRELLSQIPHRGFIDLAEVYYVRVGYGGDDAIGTIQITDKHISLWGVSENDLNEAAHENMESKEAQVKKMNDVVRECLGLDEDYEWEGDADKDDVCGGMYILTNQERNFGAAELLRRDILYGIADGLKSDIIILPSSIHEIIIIPDEMVDNEKLAKMVKEINSTQVAVDEVLSDHVYRYERATKAVSIAA
jgi:hypothetical protein